MYTDENNRNYLGKYKIDNITSISARNILLGLDKKVDPCQNFYKHVCGNFEKNMKLSNSDAQIDKFSMLMDKITDQIYNLIQEDIDPKDPTSFKLLKTYFHSCIDKSKLVNIVI